MIPVVVNVNGGISASFTDTQALNAVTFTNTSGSGITWLWNYGDGTATDTTHNAVHTYTANGTYTVTLHGYNGACSDSITETVTIVGLGIGSYLSQSGMLLYPNPTTGSFVLELNLVQNEKAEVKIMNALGQIILDENHNLISGKNILPPIVLPVVVEIEIGL